MNLTGHAEALGFAATSDLREGIRAGVRPGLQNLWGVSSRGARWVRFPCSPAILGSLPSRSGAAAAGEDPDADLGGHCALIARTVTHSGRWSLPNGAPV